MVRALGLVTGVAIFVASSIGCATSGARPRPFPTPASHPPDAVPSAGGAIERGVLATALELRGVPYRNGGTDPAGFDCSGFTQYVFAAHGVALPRETSEQFKRGHSVPRGRVQPGDLIFFTTTAPGASHVGIVVDADAFVHAPSSRGVVRVERFTSSYWATRLVGVRRVTN